MAPPSISSMVAPPTVATASVSAVTVAGSTGSTTSTFTTRTVGSSSLLPGVSSASSVSLPRGPATATATRASGSSSAPRLQPNLPPLPSPDAQRDIAEARQAIDASIANLLDTQLQDRATHMHGNMRAIAEQQRDLGRALAGLRKANDGLARLVHEFTGSYKEVGHVQNWGEMQFQNINVLEETMRLVRERRAREAQREARREERYHERLSRRQQGGACAREQAGGEMQGDGQSEVGNDSDGDSDSWSSSGSYSGSDSGSDSGSSHSRSRSRSAAGDAEAVAEAVPEPVPESTTAAETKSGPQDNKGKSAETGYENLEPSCLAADAPDEASLKLDKGKGTDMTMGWRVAVVEGAVGKRVDAGMGVTEGALCPSAATLGHAEAEKQPEKMAFAETIGLNEGQPDNTTEKLTELDLPDAPTTELVEMPIRTREDVGTPLMS